MIGIATGSIRTEGHAVATPLQRDTIQKRALWRLGSDCDRAPDLPPIGIDYGRPVSAGPHEPLRG
jgi:hypothetical protein